MTDLCPQGKFSYSLAFRKVSASQYLGSRVWGPIERIIFTNIMKDSNLHESNFLLLARETAQMQ